MKCRMNVMLKEELEQVAQNEIAKKITILFALRIWFPFIGVVKNKSFRYLDCVKGLESWRKKVKSANDYKPRKLELRKIGEPNSCFSGLGLRRQ